MDFRIADATSAFMNYSNILHLVSGLLLFGVACYSLRLGSFFVTERVRGTFFIGLSALTVVYLFFSAPAAEGAATSRLEIVHSLFSALLLVAMAHLEILVSERIKGRIEFRRSQDQSIAETDEEIDKLIAANEGWAKAYQELQQKTEKVHSEIDKLKLEAQKAKLDSDRFRAESDKLRHELATKPIPVVAPPPIPLKAESAEDKALIEQLKKSNTTLLAANDELQKLVASMRSETADHKNLVTAIQTESTEHKKLATALQAEATEQRNLATALQAEATEQKTLVIALQTEAVEQKTLVATLQNETAQQKDLVASLQAEAVEKLNLMAAQQAEAAEQKKLVTNLVEANEGLAGANKELLQATASLQEQIAEQQKNREHVESAYQELLESSRQVLHNRPITACLRNIETLLDSVHGSVSTVAQSLTKSHINRITQLSKQIQPRSNGVRNANSRYADRHVPVSLAQVAKQLTDQQVALAKTMKTVKQKIQHIQEIVAVEVAEDTSAMLASDLGEAIINTENEYLLHCSSTETGTNPGELTDASAETDTDANADSQESDETTVESDASV